MLEVTNVYRRTTQAYMYHVELTCQLLNVIGLHATQWHVDSCKNNNELSTYVMPTQHVGDS